MVLYKNVFQKEAHDAIAVIYELLPNYCRKAIKPVGSKLKWYALDETKDYLIICGLSTWRKEPRKPLFCSYKAVKTL